MEKGSAALKGIVGEGRLDSLKRAGLLLSSRFVIRSSSMTTVIFADKEAIKKLAAEITRSQLSPNQIKTRYYQTNKIILMAEAAVIR